MTAESTLQSSTFWIESVNKRGQGVARYEGRPAFVDRSLQGEQVVAKPVRKKRNYSYWQVQEILEASPERTAPLCPVAHDCGGCSIQHASVDEQLRYVQQWVAACVSDRIDGILWPQEQRSISAWAWRRRSTLMVGPAGVRELGLFRPATHRIVATDHCAVDHDLINLVRAKLQSDDRMQTLPGWSDVTGQGLRAISIRVDAEGTQCALGLHGRGQWLEDPQLLEHIGELCHDDGYSLNWIGCIETPAHSNALRGDVVQSWGDPWIRESLLGIHYEIHAGAFIQQHPEASKMLYQILVDQVQSSGHTQVEEWFAGSGVLAQLLANHDVTVRGYEYDPRAIEGFQRTASLQPEKERADVSLLIKNLYEDPPQCTAPLLLVDPPRKGLGRKMCGAIAQSPVQKILYTSCNPESLGQDLDTLLAQGFDVEQAYGLAMFPHTLHAELVVVLSRQAP